MEVNFRYAHQGPSPYGVVIVLRLTRSPPWNDVSFTLWRLQARVRYRKVFWPEVYVSLYGLTERTAMPIMLKSCKPSALNHVILFLMILVNSADINGSVVHSLIRLIAGLKLTCPRGDSLSNTLKN